MAGIVVLGEIGVDPAQREAWHELLVQHRKGVLAEEQGCLALNVYVDPTDPNRYALFEFFADQAAVDVHRNSVRLGKFREVTDPMVVSREIWAVDERNSVDISYFPGAQT